MWKLSSSASACFPHASRWSSSWGIKVSIEMRCVSKGTHRFSTMSMLIQLYVEVKPVIWLISEMCPFTFVWPIGLSYCDLGIAVSWDLGVSQSDSKLCSVRFFSMNWIRSVNSAGPVQAGVGWKASTPASFVFCSPENSRRLRRHSVVEIVKLMRN